MLFALFHRAVGPVVFLLALIACGVAPALAQISTADYYPMNQGDRRVLSGLEGTGSEVITGQALINGYNSWRVALIRWYDNNQSVYYWYVDAAGAHLIAGEAAGYKMVFDPPVVIPAVVNAGDEIRQNGKLVLQDLGFVLALYDVVIRVTSINETVETPAGTFTQCLDLTMEMTLTTRAGQQVTVSREKRAPGVGTVWLQTEAGASPLYLLYAEVAGRTYGPPPLRGEDYFAFHDGDIWRYVDANGAKVEVTARGPVSFFNVQAYEMEIRDGASVRREYWAPSAGNVYYHGFREGTTEAQFAQPVRMLSDQFWARQYLRSEGNYTSGATVKSYRALTRVISVSEQATVPVGTFGGCVYITTDITVGTGTDVTKTRIRRLLAPGIGPIRIEIYDFVSGVAQLVRTLELEYARIAGQEYQPDGGTPGDVDGDGVITRNDARLVIEALLAGAAGYNRRCDLFPYDGALPNIFPRPDGRVTPDDLAAFVAIYRHLRAQ